MLRSQVRELLAKRSAGHQRQADTYSMCNITRKETFKCNASSTGSVITIAGQPAPPVNQTSRRVTTTYLGNGNEGPKMDEDDVKEQGTEEPDARSQANDRSNVPVQAKQPELNLQQDEAKAAAEGKY